MENKKMTDLDKLVAIQAKRMNLSDFVFSRRHNCYIPGDAAVLLHRYPKFDDWGFECLAAYDKDADVLDEDSYFYPEGQKAEEYIYIFLLAYKVLFAIGAREHQLLNYIEFMTKKKEYKEYARICKQQEHFLRDDL